jgi:hypothetical protein
MRLVPFETNVDLGMLHGWLDAHGERLPPASEFPQVGYIAFDERGAIAVGFLRMVEGGYGQMDGFTTNPERLSAHRHQALEMIVNKLTEDAKASNLSALLVLTKDPTTIKRAETRHGYVKLPLTLLAVNLNPQEK